MAVKDAKGVEVGQLTVAVTALAALREIDASLESSAVVVELAQLTLTKPPKEEGKRGGAAVLVEVDVLGAHTQRTPRLAAAGAVGHKGAGTYAISFKQSFDAASGSALHSALLAALQSDEQTDSEVQFAVLSVDAKGEEKELGVAAVSLEALLEKGADHSLGAVAVKDAKGVEVGQLTVAVTALAAAKQAQSDARDAAEAAAVGKVGVKLTQLELTQPAAVKAARRTGVIVEVDLPGAEAQRTPNLQPHGDGKCAITFKQSFDAASGSKVRKAIAAALQSDEQTDSEVQFAVLSVDAKGEEKELGVAAVSLEALLEKGADHSLGAVAVKDAKGVEVGKLTLAITALSTLRAHRRGRENGGRDGRGLSRGGDGDAGVEHPSGGAEAAAAGAAAAGGRSGGALRRRCRRRRRRRCLPAAPAVDQVVVRMTGLEMTKAGHDARARLERTAGTPLPTVVLELDFLDPSDKSDAVASPSLAVSADGTVGALDFSHTLSTAPGTATRAQLVEALASSETQDSDVYFVLHAEGAPATPGAKPPRHELASGFVNLETLLRERKALVGEVLQLSAPAADGATEAVLGTVRVDLDALAALDSVKQEMAAARRGGDGVSGEDGAARGARAGGARDGGARDGGARDARSSACSRRSANTPARSAPSPPPSCRRRSPRGRSSASQRSTAN